MRIARNAVLTPTLVFQMRVRLVFLVGYALAFAVVSLGQVPGTPRQVSFVTSKDGTRIALECTARDGSRGSEGTRQNTDARTVRISQTSISNEPTLLIVHGGTGDRSRWQPLVPLFAAHFTVCAMDRRGHGQSEPGPAYALQKEVEDVAAAVNAQPAAVFVLGHSIGGVFALEAALLTNKIRRLVLYEPPLQDSDHTAVADRMQKMIQAGQREQALLTFLREVVMISPDEVAAMKARGNWPERVAGIDIQIRELRALSKYQFDARRVRKLKTPTLLLTGSKTASPQLKQAINSLRDNLPNRSLVVLEGEEHNAMDRIPEKFAEVVTMFLIGKE